MIIVGLLSFAGTFAFAWFTKPKPQPQNTQAKQISTDQQPIISQQDTAALAAMGPLNTQVKKNMSEKQLKSLIYEVREKIQEYESRLKELETQEQRLQVAQGTLKKDIKELSDLRIELTSTIVALKNERDKLEKSKVEISEIEKSNLVSIAATYDKMDTEAAGKILANMSHNQNSNIDDAVKILYYMSERSKAKLLAQLSTSEPELAAFFCKKLKQITEKK
jgi:flagellar motility protein MotE (MotC chaperone)